MDMIRRNPAAVNEYALGMVEQLYSPLNDRRCPESNKKGTEKRHTS